MPLYTYRCTTCDATLEILHRLDQLKTRCGLDCQLRGLGDFGKGEVTRMVVAANVDTRSSTPSREERRRDARRQAALAQMGGPVTESEIAQVKDAGLTVYRKESAGRWERDGRGQDGSPKSIERPEDDR